MGKGRPLSQLPAPSPQPGRRPPPQGHGQAGPGGKTAVDSGSRCPGGGGRSRLASTEP